MYILLKMDAGSESLTSGAIYLISSIIFLSQNLMQCEVHLHGFTVIKTFVTRHSPNSSFLLFEEQLLKGQNANVLFTQ